MKILLIEDNKDIAKNISEYLKLEGYIVAWSGRGDDGLKMAHDYDFDLILLDLSLPWMDGLDICKRVKAQKKHIPIIMITARESIDDRVKWLGFWAEDYLIKPFDLRELVARIKVQERKTNISKNFETRDISINLDSRTFTKKWEKILLTQKEFLILEVLLKNIPNIVSRTDIISHVWGGEDDLFWADGKLDVYISNLRSKFGKDFIETVKGVGYKIWNP
jgi:two-component system, OmpR family, response regulator ArlR